MPRALSAIACCGAVAATFQLTGCRPSQGGDESPYAIFSADRVRVLRRASGGGVTPEDGRLLYNLIVDKGYRTALDLGTAHGYSAIWIASAMKRTGGRVTTIEIDPSQAREAQRHFQASGLGQIIDLRIGDALTEIPRLEGQFDFVFMDLGVPLNKRLLDLVYPRLAAGGAIAAHNARSFRLQQRDFLSAIENDPNLETRITPTDSGGMSISIKKSARPPS